MKGSLLEHCCILIGSESRVWLLWQVSPHEFMQAVMAASKKKFTIETQSDPVDFLSWFLNTMHLELTGAKRKKPSIITRCFQANLHISHPLGNLQ